MKLYICEACNFSSKIKTHLERHKNTKKHRDMIENNEKTALLYGLKMTVTQNDPKMTQNDLSENFEKKKKFFEYLEKKKKKFYESIGEKFETSMDYEIETQKKLLEEEILELKKKKNFL